MYSCCKTQTFAGPTTPKLINTSADKSDQSFLMIWADKSFISSGQVVYFQTVSSHSQKFFKIGVLKNFAKLTKMYLCRILFITLQHNFLEFENKKKFWLIFQLFISFLVIRMWSFFFLAIIDFNSDLNFINRNSSFVDRYGCMKYEGCLGKSV